MMYGNDVSEIIETARKEEDGIFSPDWSYFAQFPALELRYLCALTVGLNPRIICRSKELFGMPIDLFPDAYSDASYMANDKTERAMTECRRRLDIAIGNLSPVGSLPVARGARYDDESMVGIADFATWVAGMGWQVQPEFVRMGAARKGPRTGGDALAGKSRTTALKIIGGLAMMGYGMNIHAERLEGIGDMVKDLQRAGADTDENALRKWIKEAATVIAPPSNNTPSTASPA